jgi:hypothetical protein
VRNKIRVNAHPLVQQALGEIWKLQEIPAIAIGETKEFWASFRYGNLAVPATGIVTPVKTTDYTANTQSDGLGGDLSDGLAVTITNFGMSSKITVANGSGSAGYITLLRLRGEAITSPDVVYFIGEDAASQAEFDVKTFTLDSRWLQETLQPSVYASYLIDIWKDPRLFATVQIMDRPEDQFGMDLFSVLDLTVADIGIDANYRIGHIEHEWIDEVGQVIRTTWKLEPYIDIGGSYWVFSTQIGITSRFAP